MGAVAVAALASFGRGALRALPRPLVDGAGRSVAALRDLHSGHVGDYVAWLTVAPAGLGGVFALALT